MEWKSLNTAASPHRRIINAINIQHDFPHFYLKMRRQRNYHLTCKKSCV